MKNYICDKNKYFFGNGYIATSVEIENLPKKLTLNNRTFLIKSSFHVSLVCVKNIVLRLGEDFEQKIINLFCDFTSKNKISFIDYKEEIRYAVDKKTGRETIIIMCDVSNLKKFFGALNKKFGLNTETPPTHVTLYTLQQDKGIGLNNISDIKDKTIIITEQISQEIKNKFVLK